MNDYEKLKQVLTEIGLSFDASVNSYDDGRESVIVVKGFYDDENACVYFDKNGKLIND